VGPGFSRVLRENIRSHSFAATIFEENHRIPCGIVSHEVQTNRTESRISVSNSREMETANLRRLTLRTAKGCGETFIETDTYLNLGGVPYSFVILKDLPDATSRAS
jgi:hypothetical protein